MKKIIEKRISRDYIISYVDLGQEAFDNVNWGGENVQILLHNIGVPWIEKDD